MIAYFTLSEINITSFFFIKIWGFFVALGIGISLLILYQRSRQLKLETAKMLDLAFYLLVFGLIFARLFHILFYAPNYYFSNLIEIFKIWHGGMSSFGGIFGATVSFIWFIKKNMISWPEALKIADLFSFSAIFGWIIGRFGCFFIHDHIGQLNNSFLAVQFPNGSRLDMALMEIFGLLPLVVVFIIIRKKVMFSGFYLSTVLIYYGLLRFIFDFYRATDLSVADVRYLGLTPGQYFGIVLAIIGLVSVKYANRTLKTL
jgi:phosphatidylglycerol:prolipoprotein diacylglycerol transferase